MAVRKIPRCGGKKAKLYTKKSPRNIIQLFGDILMTKINTIY